MKRIKKELSGKELIALAQKATKRAWNENFALGLPIVIEENGNVIKKYKDGKTKVIKK
ncbi:MAG TPA: hypothetical protein VHZ50_00270 [Puia sp.]|jgi:hypothetical protein|nr:hypothetical protein [Puia sp.]